MFKPDSSWIQPSLLNSALSRLYRGASALRNDAYDRGLFGVYQCALPVLSVGNIQVGGSGKSPFVRYLVEGLRTRTHRPAIILRGYGGSLRGPHEVSGLESVGEVGDEALMHREAFSKEVAVVIARERSAGAALVQTRNLGDLVVLDDGFQHRQLARDLDLVLVNAGDAEQRSVLEGDRMLPAGPLREGAAALRSRAGIVLSVEHDARSREGAKFVRRLIARSEVPVFSLGFNYSSLHDMVSGASVHLRDLKDRDVLALSAIASPERFHRLLGEIGFNVVSCRAYPDHHLFSAEEWRDIARDPRLLIVTTTKDRPKLRDFVLEEGRVLVLDIEAAFCNPEEEGAFWSAVTTAVERARDRRGE